MKKIINLLVVTFVIVLSIQTIKAQKPITKFYIESESFSSPLILDSLDNQGKKFSIEDFFNAPQIKENYLSKEITTDAVGMDTIRVPFSFLEDYYIEKRYFNITLSKREKVKFEVYSNAQLKISIDGEQVSEKTTQQEDINQEDKVLVEKELEPGNHIIGIGALCLSSKIKENNYFYKIKVLIYEDEVNLSKNASGLTLKTMLCGENPYRVSISDSGNYYLIKYYNTDTEGKSTYRIEVRSTEDDEVVFVDNKITAYEWKPKTNLLYYKDKDKLYVLNPQNKERTLLLDDNMDITGSVSFLDDGSYILSKTSERDNTSADLHRMYLPDDRIPGWRNRTELYYYGKNKNGKLFHTFRSTYLNDIKEHSILFSISKDNITKRPFTFNNIYQYNLDNNKIDTLVENDGFVALAQYLQDGKTIVMKASNEAFNSLGSTLKKNQIPNAFNYSIYLMDLQTKEIKPVGKNFSPNVTNIAVRKNNLYLTCENKDSVAVYRYNIKDNAFYLLNLDVDIVHSFDISQDESQIVFYGENYNKPKRVFHAVMDTNNYSLVKVKEVFFPKKKEFEQLTIGKMETFSFPMHNSNIDGRLYYPADFDSTKKYPMIVYYYGGCSPTDRSFEMRYSAWLYTQQGYIVYVINPSGTTGWGQEFAARHVNAWGDYTANEIIEGVKRVCKTYNFIDAKHIGCMGASYGGFMTQYLQTKTDIFACAVSHAGISNITSYWGEGYWGYSYSGASTSDNYPWNNPDLYTKHSPLFNADKIHTPLLLLHGTDDTNVPIGESIQMYNALKILGREVEFITIKGENHGIVDFEKRLKWNNTIYAWFAKWLKEDNSGWDALYPKENY
ncbi:MAG: S9 family peptidase [Bacteroidota bacterium]|nr:S9 family peptidase [Bacteroidota bacterium]